jgi:hypothetical protein
MDQELKEKLHALMCRHGGLPDVLFTLRDICDTIEMDRIFLTDQPKEAAVWRKVSKLLTKAGEAAAPLIKIAR